MADVLAGPGVDDQDTAVSVPIGDVEAVGAASTTMSAAWYNKGVSWMPPRVSLLFGP